MKNLTLFLSLILLPFVATSRTNVDSLRAVAENGMELNPRIDATKRLIRYYREYKIDSAWYYTDKLKEIHAFTGSKKAQMEYYVYTSDLQSVSLNFLNACESLIKLVRITDEDSLWDYQVFAYQQLANASMNLGQYDKALIYADSSRIISEAYGDELYTAGTLNTIALVYGQMKMYPLSVEYNQQALNLRIKHNDKRAQITSYNNLGIAHKRNDNLQGAIDAYMMVVKLATELEYVSSLFRVYNNIANLYRENDRIDLAHKYYLKCDSIVKTGYEVPLDVHEAYTNGITNTYIKKGNMEMASDYFDKNMMLRDSLSRLEVKNATSSLENQMSFFEHEAELLTSNMALAEEKQKTEVALLESRSKVTMTIAIILGFAMCVIILVLVLKRQMRISKEKERQKLQADKALQKSLDEKQNLQASIKQKSTEITNLAIGIKNKNEILDQLLEDMETHSADPNINIKLNEIYKKVREVIQLDRDRDLLELYISDIHSDFGIKMKEKSKDLTEKEIKISGLIRLGMSSKEISLLMNISPGSVDTYRYNIRKKLKMGKEKSLANLLAEL